MMLSFRNLMQRLGAASPEIEGYAGFIPLGPSPSPKKACNKLTVGATNAVRIELLSGKRHSIQSMGKAVRERGYTLNHVNSRINDAKRQLKLRGVHVSVEKEGNHQVWFVKPSDTSRKLLTEMKGYE